MKMLARSYFWWPKLGTDIEKVARECQLTGASPPKLVSSASTPMRLTTDGSAELSLVFCDTVHFVYHNTPSINCSIRYCIMIL